MSTTNPARCALVRKTSVWAGLVWGLGAACPRRMRAQRPPGGQVPGDTKTQTGQQREKAVGGVEAENLAAVFMDEGEDEFQARYRGRKITITGEARSTTSFPLVMIN